MHKQSQNDDFVAYTDFVHKILQYFDLHYIFLY